MWDPWGNWDAYSLNHSYYNKVALCLADKSILEAVTRGEYFLTF